MTGGRAIILGGTGRNFAAGMSGGIAYVLDTIGDFPSKVNPGMVEVGEIEDDEEADEVRELIEMHVRFTGSSQGEAVLARWPEARREFVRVIPTAFRRVLELQRTKKEAVHG